LFCRQRHLLRTCLACNPAHATSSSIATTNGQLTRKRCAACWASAPNARARQNLAKVRKKTIIF
jgi:hypothetical protein